MTCVGCAHAIGSVQDLAIRCTRKPAGASRNVCRSNEDREGHVRRRGALLGEDQRSRDQHARGEERDEQDADRLGAHFVTLRAHYARVIAEE